MSQMNKATGTAEMFQQMAAFGWTLAELQSFYKVANASGFEALHYWNEYIAPIIGARYE